jgi:hypothetical protein
MRIGPSSTPESTNMHGESQRSCSDIWAESGRPTVLPCAALRPLESLGQALLHRESTSRRLILPVGEVGKTIRAPR